MAEKVKLSQAVVKALQAEGSQREVWDLEQPGFGVRIGVGGSKTYFVMTRVNHRVVRATVGKFPQMPLEDARKRARKMLVDMADGINPNDEKRQQRADSLAFGTVFESFIKTRKTLSDRTVEFYRGVFDRHLAAWKARHISEITSAMVLERHGLLGETKGKNAANHTIRLLRAVMNHSRAVNGVPAENPAAVMSGAKAWFKDGRRSVVIKPADMPRWFEEVKALENETGRDYLMLVLFTGLRRNEAMALRWEDVDLDNRLMTTVRKGDITHTLPLPAYLYDLLKARQEHWGNKGYVFPSWSKTGHLTNVQHVMLPLQAKGLNYTLHDLRRTFITTAESLDISTYVVKRLANHKQSDVTGKHYIVHDIDRLREPMERISRALLEMGRQL